MTQNALSMRYELKLVCPAIYLSRVQSWVRVHPEGFFIQHPPRQVNSIYYDTPMLDCLAGNLRGDSDRQKMRLRWYGSDQQDLVAQLELKRKRNQLGDKKIFKLPFKIDLKTPWSVLHRQMRQAAPPAWKIVLDQAIRPLLLNRYYREYYVSRDSAIRLTLDYKQRAYDQRFTQSPNIIRPTLIQNNMVIEVKSGTDVTERLHEAMTHFPLPRIRHSKYVNGVLAAF